MGGYFTIENGVIDLGVIREENVVKNIPVIAVQSPDGNTRNNTLAVFLAGTKEIRIIGTILFDSETSKNEWIRKLDNVVKGLSFNAVKYYPKSFSPYSDANYLSGYITSYSLRFSETNTNLLEYDITFTEGKGIGDW